LCSSSRAALAVQTGPQKRTAHAERLRPHLRVQPALSRFARATLYDSCVFCLILLASMQVEAAFAGQTVDGRVVNAVTGIGVPHAAVNFIRADEVAYSATTDSQGHFRIDTVGPGSYMATYTARGYWPIPNYLVDEDFERQCGRCFMAERGGQPFQVTAGGDPVRLEVKMSPIGKIAGRVLDDVGQPVANAGILLHWGDSWLCELPLCTGIFRETKTNEKGEYSVTDLDVPGTWLLSAVAPSSWKPGWAQTFYPGVTDPRLAVRVMVRVGGDISNLEIKLAAVPVHRIGGVVLDTRGNPVPAATVELRKGVGSPAVTRSTRNDGTFAFEAVTEGEWRITANADHGGAKLWTAQSVHLEAHDLEHLELRAAAPFGIQGKVVVEVPEGAPAPRPPSVMLVPNEVGSFPTRVQDARGEFQIRNIYVDAYEILPEPAPPQCYLDSIRIGGRDALESGVAIVPGSPPLTVTYKFGGGTVRGTVEKCAAGTVRLLPHDKAMWRPGFVFFAPCDSNDRYAITAVRPGEYYAVAIAGDIPAPWYATSWDDDSLVNYAATITVRAGENTSADLRAIKQ
jgi:hypothetical protein